MLKVLTLAQITIIIMYIVAGSNTTTRCSTKECEHPRAFKWVECEDCSGWYHQVCVGIKLRSGESGDIDFICEECLQCY